MHSTSHLLSKFKTFVESFDYSSFSEDASRKQALEAARSLVHRLEKPMDTMLRIAWTEPTYAAALKTGIDMGLFQALADAGKEGKRNVEALAKSTSSDPVLVGRILRLLAAMDAVKECDGPEYGPTNLSLALAEPIVNSALDFRYNLTNPIFQSFPRFLAETSYRNPNNGNDCPLQYAFQTKLPFFQWMSKHPDIQANFNTHMASYTSHRGTWDEIYPVAERLRIQHEDADDKEDTVLVDVGGGVGHDLSRFANRFLPKGTRPRLILEDLPSVVATTSKGVLPPTIKAMAHDFFQRQPVRGARGYYMHSVLHAWPDHEASKILEAMHSALMETSGDGQKPKLLINEIALPRTGTKMQAASLDLLMCGFKASSERSEKEWRALFEASGYRVNEVYISDAVDETLIEAEAL